MNPEQQITSKTLETMGPQGKAASFFIQNWKQILLAVLIWILVVIMFSVMSVFLICSCLGGAFQAGLLRGFSAFDLSGGTTQSHQTTGTPGGTEFDEDCFVKLVQEANPNVTKETAKQYKNYITESSNQYNINAALIAAIIAHESDPDWHNNNCSYDRYSRGIAQITTYDPNDGCTKLDDNPRTWETTIVPGIRRDSNISLTNIMEEKQSILGATWYLYWINKNFGLTDKNLMAAYNGGPGCIRNNIIVCPEAQRYANTVETKYQKYKKCLQTIQYVQGLIKCNVVYINQNEQGLSGGCGPTSLAMIFQTYGKNISPQQIISKGTQTCTEPQCGMKNPGVVIPLINSLSDLQWKSASTWSEIENQVKNGNPVAVGTGFSGNSGHWIVIIGFMENGDIIANDPAGNHGEYYNGGYIDNNGENVIYNKGDFHKHFDQDPRYPGGVVFNIYVNNPPSKINCE